MKIWPVYEVTFEFDEFITLMNFWKNSMPSVDTDEESAMKVMGLHPGDLEKLRKMYKELSTFLPR